MNNRKIKALLLSLSITAACACGRETDAQLQTTSIDTTMIPVTVTEERTVASKTLESIAYETKAPFAGGNYTIIEEEIDVVDITTSIISETPYLYDEPTVAFDEVHDYVVGETECVGRRGLLFRIDSITTDETGYITVKYTLTSDGKEYKGEGGRFADGTIREFVQDEFTPNVTSLYWCEDAEDLSYASVIITSDIEVPEPLVLSGNPDDIYEIGEPEYMENEDFILFLSEGTSVRGDIMERISGIIDVLETETGFKLNNSSKFASYRSDRHLGSFAEALHDVDYRMQKFHIYVLPYEESSPCAFATEVIVNPMDVVPEADFSTLVHELTHALHLRNGIDLGRMMTEGYATYMTDIVLEKYPEIQSDFNSAANYSGLFITITSENAESVLKSEYEDDFDNYLIGYRFLHFLFEEHGNNIFRDILKEATDNAGSYESQITNEKAMEYVKKNTEEKVFEKFALWLSENEAEF